MSYDEDDKVKEASYDEDEVGEVDEDINLDELMAELEEMSYDEDDDVKEGKDDEEVKEGKDEDEVKEGKDEDEVKEGKKKDDELNESELNESYEALLAALPALGITAVAAQGYGLGSKLKAAKGAREKLEVMGDFIEAMGSGAGGGIQGGGRAEESVSENIDIDALIAEIEADLEEGKDEDEVKEGKKKDDEDAKNEVKKAKEELKEAYATVESLKSTISEMNLLNSKLLYCNKLFRANALTEAQKVKVIDALDKSETTSEAKLVFETLQESFAFTGVEKRAIKEGLGRASKAAGTAPKKVITESVDETVSRFQKLANINK